VIAIPIMLSAATVGAKTIDMEVTTPNVFVPILKNYLKTQKYKKHFELQSKLSYLFFCQGLRPGLF